MPALWLAERRRMSTPVLLVAAIVPPVLLLVGLFIYGSVLPVEPDNTSKLAVVQFVLGATTATGVLAVSALVLLRRAGAVLAKQ